MANTKHDLTQTKKIFKLIGKVSGVESKNYYQESTTKNGRGMRVVNFCVETSDTNKVYVQLMGIEQDSVYFTKKVEEGKWETEKVAWGERNKFSKDGYRLAGSVNVGLTKAIDASGKEVNANVHLVPYDACLSIKGNLKDGMAVFVRGTKEVSTYVDKEGSTRVSVKLSLNQISLKNDQDAELPTEDSIVYDAKNIDNIPNEFEDNVIFEEIKVDEGSTADNFSATMTTLNVAFDSICEVDYKIHNPQLAKTFKDRLKPYNALTIKGAIFNSAIVSEDENNDDGWGIFSAPKKVTDYKREYVILGIDPASLDTTSYNKEKIEKAKASLLEFNENESKTTTSSNVKSEDVAVEAEPW